MLILLAQRNSASISSITSFCHNPLQLLTLPAEVGERGAWKSCSCHGLTGFLLIELEGESNSSPKPHKAIFLWTCQEKEPSPRPAPTKSRYTWSSWLYWDAANEQYSGLTRRVYLEKVTVSSYLSFRKDQETKQALVDTLSFTIVFSSASFLTELLWPCIPLHFMQCNHGSGWNSK